MDEVCPDCRHKVSDHDVFGCTLYGCSRFPKNEACLLTGEFLIEYFKENI